MLNYVLSLLVGLSFGAITKAFNLPIPAPPMFEGVLAIFGVTFGYYIIGKFL